MLTHHTLEICGHLLPPLQEITLPLAESHFLRSRMNHCKQLLIGHGLHHADGQHQPQPHRHPLQVAVPGILHPAEHGFFHVPRGHQQQQGSPKPLLQVLFQLLIQILQPDDMSQEAAEQWDGNHTHDEPRHRTQNGPQQRQPHQHAKHIEHAESTGT